MGPGTTHSAVVSTRSGRANKTAVAVFAAPGGRLRQLVGRRDGVRRWERARLGRGGGSLGAWGRVRKGVEVRLSKVTR